MSHSASADVCIVIAAKDAEATIARAVMSALAQTEAREVVVVDDASNDQTEKAARQCDDGSNRLKVVRFNENRGPSAARNHAISISRADVIAVLDADDFFLPGRLERLLQQEDWDLVADNIAFIADRAVASGIEERIQEFPTESYIIDFVGFVEGNISRRAAQRGEIGFLKPLMRRSFLERHRIRYNEVLRLGEDYDLYARALACGARYKVTRSCGYAAVVRDNSLSGRHRTYDLERLYEADCAIMANNADLDRAAMSALKRHARHVRDRYELRRFLDVKNHEGGMRAVVQLLGRPSTIRPVAAGILGDKVERFFRRGRPRLRDNEMQEIRYLL
ncbi:glycosyltransferase family 2 protein [Rhizobium sp. YTU87027]|uniref:glycosyltransferase family 2 protein n=1 Tax=Rhizobium sp. YTU87027 TaxID=3417741 RepID=UPI003D68D104